NNMSNTSSLAGFCIPVGTHIITWRITDQAGLFTTCNISVTVIDNTPPVITCPPNINLPCPDNIPDPNIALVLSNDNCLTTSIAHVRDTFFGLAENAGFCPTSIQRTYRATDAAGNSSTCVKTLTTLDDCGCDPCQAAVPFHPVNMTAACDFVWGPVRLGRVRGNR